MKLDLNSEFAPGAGLFPPVLAGREKEKKSIAMAFRRLEAGLNPKANIALIGPRGNGKTALLRWAEAQADRHNGKVTCKVLNPGCFQSISSLVDALADNDVFAAPTGNGCAASANSFGSEIGLSRQEIARELLRPVLEKKCSKSGLALLIDEAHTLGLYSDIARTFFNDVQELAGNGQPLLLILAGTPNVRARLNSIEATFWNRLKKFGIGLLDADSACEALRVPLERMGYLIEASTLEQAANESQCYPYFIQVIGDALHETSEEEPGMLASGNTIGDAILKRALTEAGIAMNTYYSDRYLELRDLGILPAAEAVAWRFVSKKKKTISRAEFEVAVANSIDPQMVELAKSRGGIEPSAWFEAQLRDAGLVWSLIGFEHTCEPGIPSLMDYIVEMARNRDLESEANRQSTPHNLGSRRNGADDVSSH